MRLLLLMFGMCILLLSYVSASITYAHSYYDKPNITLELVSGGSLDANQNYQYRAMTANGIYLYGDSHVSQPSDIVNITTNSTHKSVKISISHSTGNPEYTFLWVAKENDIVPYGEWWDWDSYDIKNIPAYSTSYLLYAINSSKTTSFVDDGTYRTSGTGANNDILLFENARDYLYTTCTGGETITLKDIYENISASNRPNSTIIKVDTVPYAVPEDTINHDTYRLNFHYIRFVGNCNVVITDTDVISYVNAFRFDSGTTLRIGKYESAYDFAHQGINWRQYGRYYYPAGKFLFQAGSNIMMYDSVFRLHPLFKGHGAYESVDIYSNNYTIVDSSFSGGWNRGFRLLGGSSDSLLRRVQGYDNSWETNMLSSSASLTQFEDVTYTLWGSYGPWIYVTNYDVVSNYTIKGLTVKGQATGNMNLWLQGGGHSAECYYTSRVSCIDCDIIDWMGIYWYKKDNDCEAWLKRMYSINFKIVDKNGNPVENANITIQNNNSDIEFSVLTNASGQIDEQYITSYRYDRWTENSGMQDVEDVTNYNPFTLKITQDNRMPISYQINITEPVDWTINPEDPVFEYIAISNDATEGLVIT